VKGVFGTGNDLEIYHDGSNSIISDAGTGNLQIRTDGANIQLNKGTTENMLVARTDGAVELYHDNVKHFETISGGIRVQGTEGGNGSIELYADEGDDNADKRRLLIDTNGDFYISNYADGAWETDIMVYQSEVRLYYDNSIKLQTASGGISVTGGINLTTNLSLLDNGIAKFGTGDDLQIYHDGNNSIIDESGTGSLFIKSSIFYVNSPSGEDMISATANGAVRLYYDNVLTCYTSNGCLAFPDSQAIFMGADNDLQIQHDGSNSIIKDNGTGDLQLRAENFRVQNKEGTASIIHGNAGAAVELYHNGTKRFETNSIGFGGLGMLNAGPTSNSGSTYHDIRNSTDGQWLAALRHTTGTSPYGIWLGFTAASPDTNGNEFIRFDDSTQQRFRVNSDGDIYTADSGIINSDRTMKENIVDASPKLDDLMKLKVRNFSWKKEFHPAKEGHKKIGFIAQEVEEVFPKLVTESNIAPLGKPDVIKKEIKQAWAPIIIKALQEAITKIETLETKVAALEAA